MQRRICMFKEYQDTFRRHLTGYEREAAVDFTQQLLAEKKITVPQLYEQIVAPVLDSIKVCKETEDSMIWKEHIMTNIARTVVECAFPFVLRQKNPDTVSNSRFKIAVVCPEDEYHDLGARMGADYFAMENYQVLFIGGNTPLNNVVSMCKTYQPNLLALSVSNFYHIVMVKSIIAALQKLEHQPKILLSGSAFLNTNIPPDEFGSYTFVHSYKQVQELGGGV